MRHDLVQDRGQEAAMGHVLPAGKIAGDFQARLSGSLLGIGNGQVQAFFVLSAAAEAQRIRFDRRVHGGKITKSD